MRRPCGPHSPRMPHPGRLQKACQPQSGRAPASRVWPSKRQEGRTCAHRQCHCSAVHFCFGLCRVLTAVHGLSCPAACGILLPRPGVPGLQLVVEVWGPHSPSPDTPALLGISVKPAMGSALPSLLAGACPPNTTSGRGGCSVVLRLPGLLSQRKDENLRGLTEKKVIDLPLWLVACIQK